MAQRREARSGSCARSARRARQIAALFVGESAIGGLIGSALGVAGRLRAGGVVAGRAAGVPRRSVYGVSPGAVERRDPARGSSRCAIAVGTATSVLAASCAGAQRRARRSGHRAAEGRSAGARRRRASRGRRCLAAADRDGIGRAADGVRHSPLPLFYLGYLCVLVAALLLTPLLSPWARPQRSGRCCAVFGRSKGALAADSLIAAPTRTSATVAALMLSLALAIGLAGIGARRATRASATGLDTALNPDFFVTGSPTLTERNYRFPDSMSGELAAIAGIAEVQRMRQRAHRDGGGRVLMMPTELGKLGATSPRRRVEGDSREMFRLAAAGAGRDRLGELRDAAPPARRRHDRAPAPSGSLRLPLVGVIREYADQQGALFIDRTLFAALAGRHRRSLPRVSAAGRRPRRSQGSDPATVRGQPAAVRAVERRSARLRRWA